MSNRNQMQLQDKIGAKNRFSRVKSKKSALSMLFQRKRRKNNRKENRISIKISQNIQSYYVKLSAQRNKIINNFIAQQSRLCNAFNKNVFKK
jgi:hypothetical protein